MISIGFQSGVFVDDEEVKPRLGKQEENTERNNIERIFCFSF